MSKLVLYGLSVSPFVRKLKVVLLEKNIEHDHEQVFPLDASVELSPLKKIPYLKDAEGRAINDSSIIVEYLEERYPEPSLLPKDIYDRARARWFDEYADGKLITLVGPPNGLGFQRIAKPMFFKEEPDQEIINATLAEIPPVFEYLESQIKDRSFFVADTLSIADISIAAEIVGLQHAQYTIDEDKYPHLAKWYKQVTARPSFTQAAAIEQQLFENLKNKAG